mgnify:CR=1 FL=1
MKQLVNVCSLIFVALSLTSCGLFRGSEPVIKRLIEHNINTSSGITQGQSFAAPKTVVSWFDIPYAQPPVGDLRWRAPRPLIDPNKVIVEKTATSCAQEALYLDIRAPQDFADKSYPVMFWIHGGGNVNGHKDYYDYTNLVAAKNVIVVSINYRLGALGWFSHPAIQDLQEGLDKTSNFGSLDIIEALNGCKAILQLLAVIPTMSRFLVNLPVAIMFTPYWPLPYPKDYSTKRLRSLVTPSVTVSKMPTIIRMKIPM